MDAYVNDQRRDVRMNGKTCPICRCDEIKFFSQHNKVVQNLYECGACRLLFVYPHKPVIPGGEGDEFSAKDDCFWGTNASIDL
jgi:hypothetical protein